MKHIILFSALVLALFGCAADKVVTESKYNNSFEVPIESSGLPADLAIDSVHILIIATEGKSKTTLIDTVIYVNAFVANANVKLESIECSQSAGLDYYYEVYSHGVIVMSQKAYIRSDAKDESIPPNSIAETKLIDSLIEIQNRAVTSLAMRAQDGKTQCATTFYPKRIDATGTKEIDIGFEAATDAKCTFVGWSRNVTAGSAAFTQDSTVKSNSVRVSGAAGEIIAMFLLPGEALSSTPSTSSTTSVSSSVNNTGSSTSTATPVITIMPGATPKGTIDKVGTNPITDELKINVTPDAGYTVRSWSISPLGTVVSASSTVPNQWTIIPADVNTSVTITPIWGSTLKVEQHGGALTLNKPLTLGTDWSQLILKPNELVDISYIPPADSAFSHWDITHIGLPISDLDTSSEFGHVKFTQVAGYTLLRPVFTPLWNKFDLATNALEGRPMRIFKAANNTLALLYQGGSNLYYSSLSFTGNVLIPPKIIGTCIGATSSMGIAIAPNVINNKAYFAHQDSIASNARKYEIKSVDLNDGTIATMTNNNSLPMYIGDLQTKAIGISAMSARLDGATLYFHLAGPTNNATGKNALWMDDDKLSGVNSNPIVTTLTEIRSITTNSAYLIAVGKSGSEQGCTTQNILSIGESLDCAGTQAGYLLSAVAAYDNASFILAGASAAVNDGAFVGRQGGAPIDNIYAPAELSLSSFEGVLPYASDKSIAYGKSNEENILVATYDPTSGWGNVIIRTNEFPMTATIMSMTQVDHERFAMLVLNGTKISVLIMRMDFQMVAPK